HFKFKTLFLLRIVVPHSQRNPYAPRAGFHASFPLSHPSGIFFASLWSPESNRASLTAADQNQRIELGCGGLFANPGQASTPQVNPHYEKLLLEVT
ncbi:hypothetical protein, partial [Burkholderia cepacia]